MPSDSENPGRWWQQHDPLHLGYLETNFPCRTACPVGTNAGGYVALLASGESEKAYALARAPNPFASVCGRICAHPCEAACRRGALDAPIQIRALKRVLCEEHGSESGKSFDEILRVVERPRPKAARAGKVAIIGAGPAGLACAHDLALMGHEVVVFDSAPVAGGMLRLGVPAYRLPRDVLQKDIDFVSFLGVDIRLGVTIGKEISFSDLLRDYDAVFLAVGCRRGKGLRIPGVDLEGVVTAIDFLVEANLGLPVKLGKRVIVVGGGNVAYDAARSVRRLESGDDVGEPGLNVAVDAAVLVARSGRQVTMIALESREEMPADRSEIDEGAEEGIHLINRRGPKEILGVNGKVTGLRTNGVDRVFDENHRFAPIFASDRDEDLVCDSVVLAVGQIADLSFLGEDHGLKTTPQSLVVVDPRTLATSRAGVYAGGDLAFGPRIAISAVADGRRAARAIDTQITGRHDEPLRHTLRIFPSLGYDHPFARGDYEKIPRHHLPVLPVEKRARTSEVEKVLGKEEARAEGSRCLHCWVNTIFDSTRIAGTECIQCGGCVDVCPEQCISLVTTARIENGKDIDKDTGIRLPDFGAALLKDETVCIRCGLCARRCPSGTITMQGLYREGEEPLLRLAETIL